MIFKPLRQLSGFCIKWIFTSILIFIPTLLFPNPCEQYPFDKLEEVLIADSLFFDGFYKSAGEFYKKAYSVYRKDKNWEGVVYTLNKIGWSKTANFKEEEGYDILVKSSKIIAEHKLHESILTSDNYLYKGISLARLYRYDSAIYYHEKDISLRKKLLGERSESLAESFRHYGQCLADYGNLSQGEKYLRESIDIFSDYYTWDDQIFGRLYGTLSSILRRKYDYENAVLYAEMSLNIFRNTESDMKSVVTSLITLGNIHNHFKQYDKALHAYNQSKNVLESNQLIMDNYLRILYGNMAAFYNELNYSDSTLYFTDKYFKLLNNYGLYDNYAKCYVDIINSDAYSRAGEFDKARNTAANTLITFTKEYGENTGFLTTIYHFLGRIYQRHENYDSALYFYQKAIMIYVPGFKDPNIFSNPADISQTNDILYIYELLYEKADVLRKFYNKNNNEAYLSAAMNIHNIIDKVNDETRNSKIAEGSILAINELLKAGYEQGVDCAFELYKLTNHSKYLQNAFKLIEKSKYMLLLKSLSTAEYYDATAQEDLKNIEDSLKSQYISYQLQFETENTKDNPDSFVLTKLIKKRDQFGIALDNFKTMVTEEYPNYAMVKYDTLIKTYNDFKTYCEEYSFLGIEFYWGLKNIYVITTNQNGPEFYKVELNDSLKNSISVLQKQLSIGFSMSTSKNDFSEFTNNSYFVFKELLMESLKGYPKDQQILLIPDGPLSQLPFEILLTENVTGDYVDYQNLPYLIRSYFAGYAYSANLLLSKSIINGQSNNNLLAFSYSKLDADQDEEGRSGDQEELHHAAVELRAIRKEMGRKKSRYYYDIDATEYEFKRIASDYHIIHLAVHGEADTTSSMNTKLIFKNELDTLEDGELYMHELFGLDLSDTELAVLSACETGIGKSYTGEGVFSMARGFAYAGCPSIVMSLWRVDDRYTALLMKDFYRNLKNGENIVESLTSSKRQFISQSGEVGAHPSNWAAFVSVGKNSVIVKKSFILYYLLGGALIFIILFFFFRLKRNLILGNHT